MFRTNYKNLLPLLYAFSAQSKGKKNYVNISKMIKKEEQTSTLTSNLSSGQIFKKRFSSKIDDNANLEIDIEKQDWFQKNTQKQQHLSTQQQQINHKIRTAIRCESLYYECTKKKHKLQPRQYALIFCKILELRRLNPAQKKQNQDFSNFLLILNKKIDEMPPQELIRVIYDIKQERVTKEDMKEILPIVEKIINEFSNTQNNELQPKSFETLRLSTNIKLFYSLVYILDHTGSHFQRKLKFFLNEMLNYILFKSMKTKKHSKTGEYFPLKLKISFLHTCKTIDASNTCIKNLILSILVEKDKLTLETLLDLEKTLFENKELLQKTRKQLFTEKNIHIKYNILYRIENYINNLIPVNLKKSSNYSLLTQNLALHLSFLNQLTFEEFVTMEMNTVKDQQQSKILSLFHQAYKNALIENYATINEKEDIVNFFNKNELSSYSLFEMLNYFCNKLKKDNGQSLKPSVKKQLKQFISLLCKFYPKLNFLTQSIIIDILILSNFSNLKPILTEFFELNTHGGSSKKSENPHFMRKNKSIMLDSFFMTIKNQKVFMLHCPSQYQLFINSNLKTALKQIFNSTQNISIEKYSFYLGQYCKTLTSQNLKLFVESIINTHMRISWVNRSFKKHDVDTIYNNKDYFLTNNSTSHIEMQNQADIFGEDIAKKQQKQMMLNEKLLSTLQADQEIFREHYKIEQKIRTKLRMALKNFKFILLLFENIKYNVSQEIYKNFINQNLTSTLLMNFKSQIQCLKFQRFLTKENCSDLTQIHNLLQKIWDSTSPKVQVRNQMLMHQNAEQNQKHEFKISQLVQENLKLSEIQNYTKANQIENLSKFKQETKTQQFNEQEEQQESQESQYTEEIEYLQGKDFFELQTFKDYKLKLQKNSLFFASKNKEIFQEILKMTNDFKQLSKSSKNKLNPQLLAQLRTLLSQPLTQKNSIKIIDLPTIDDNKISKQNFNELINIEIQNLENKQIYTFKVFQKQYPTLFHFSSHQNALQNEQKISNLLQKILYVNSSKLKKNYKKKKMQATQLQNDESFAENKQKVEEKQVNFKKQTL